MAALKILLVEDEAIIAERLRLLLIKLGYTVVGVANAYKDALQMLEQLQPDMAIIDIMLNGADDGIKVAEHLRKSNDIPFIFLTAHADADTVQKATSTKPNGYLVKPYDQTDLFVAIETAISNFSSLTEKEQKESGMPAQLPPTLYVRCNEVFVRLVLRDILWLKAEGNYTSIKMPEKQYLVRGNLGELLQRLAARGLFRIHRSYAVNLTRITEIRPNNLMVHGKELPISAELRTELLRRLETL